MTDPAAGASGLASGGDPGGGLSTPIPLDPGDGPGQVGDGQRVRFPGPPASAPPERRDVIALLTDAAAPARVADLECGQGWAAINLALAYPRIAVTGLGSNPEDLPAARANAAAAGVADRVSFDVAGPGRLNRDDRYDVVFLFGCVHTMRQPRTALDRARQSLTERGVVVVISPGAAEEAAPDERTGPREGVGEELDPAEQVQAYFPAARVLWCPAPALLDPGLTSQRVGARAPEETRGWLTRRVEVDGDGLASLGIPPGEGSR